VSVEAACEAHFRNTKRRDSGKKDVEETRGPDSGYSGNKTVGTAYLQKMRGGFQEIGLHGVLGEGQKICACRNWVESYNPFYGEQNE